MVYSAKSDDANTISQFTRRKTVTITTGGTSTPANYQVKLTIAYESEMQADFDDIRFNTKSRSYIDHWIESYVASTSAVVWIELPDAITDPGSDTIWMFYGNSGISDGSIGADTFISFFDGDSTGWTEVDPNSHISFVNNRLEWSGLDRDEDAYVYQSASVNGNITIEYTYKITSILHSGVANYAVVGDMLDDFANLNNGFRSYNAYRSGDSYYGNMSKRVADSQTSGTNINFVVGTQYWVTTTVDRSGNVVTKVYSDAARTSQVGADSTLDITDLAATLQYMYLISSWNDSNSGTDNAGWMDDFRVRKYIANEPTPSYGTSQHQRRTPQFI